MTAYTVEVVVTVPAGNGRLYAEECLHSAHGVDAVDPSMFQRYNIVTEQQTANARAKLSATLNLNPDSGTMEVQSHRSAVSYQHLNGGSGWESITSARSRRRLARN